ncbi:flavin reductase family protein [Kitasatospora sp. NPDC059571]|uniref:flavin reductase family protein n=1 Tax=Kitasatospora sp. NPDC059571 TaxID=3346871 RepID=UPI0036A4366C
MPDTDPNLDFTRAMARVPGPVVVATTVDAAGRRWGFTASSFTSVSLDPPLVMLCLDRGASTHGAFTAAGSFLVNVLAGDQREIAVRFATSGVDRFAAGDTAPLELGLPGVPGAAVRIACTMHAVLDGGDHSILVGRVLHCASADGREPLLYVNRGFGRPAGLDLAVPGGR